MPVLANKQPANIMEELQWSDEYGFIRDGRVYLRGFLGFPDRQIGEVKQSVEASVAYFRDRFETAKQKVEELYRLVEEAQNKGSYLMKLLHLRQYLIEFDGLGDYPALLAKLDELETELRKTIVVNRARNLEIKQALLQEAEALADSIDWKETTEKLKELKNKWIKTGSVDKEHEEDIENKFDSVVNGFFDRRKAYFEEKNKITKYRVNRYEELPGRLCNLKTLPNGRQLPENLKKLQEQWKKVGKIPKTQAGTFWEDFKKANDHFFGLYKKTKGISSNYVRRVDPKKLAQENLCKEAESLVQSNDIVQAAERAKQLLMEWKNIGMNPKMQDRQLGDRFRGACDKIFELNYLMRVVKRKNFFFDKKPLQISYRLRSIS
jgi:polyhydroxyalkanoate synthesis regulator phasin